MPRIFDNIEHHLLPALQNTIGASERGDFCVGYFNLRGWRQIDEWIGRWPGGDGHQCRLLIGMHHPPDQELREAHSVLKRGGTIDNALATRLKKRAAAHFREQLAIGIPTSADEVGLRRLGAQLRSRHVVVKLFLRHMLHAKLYMLFRPDLNNPATAFVGSSNLTMAGLERQGELNVDVLEHDACQKLAQWFENRWTDKFCVDITDELARIIDESWATERPPYLIYLKMAFHLAQEARAGMAEFRIPADFGDLLFKFQAEAVRLAARHLNQRGGVIIGDVVGLGKTLMATALARIFEDDRGLETLIICPKNLKSMWRDYKIKYRLRAEILSISEVQKALAKLPRHRLVLIDESHNLRNREGKRYRVIQDYIDRNDSRVILLSATPYNKSYVDLSNQLRLFLEEDAPLGVRPERLLRQLGEIEFQKRYQCPVHTLAAFEKSPHADDWRDLMRLYLVRRTRSFIKQNYADFDSAQKRYYLQLANGERRMLPERKAKRLKFTVGKPASDPYARLFTAEIVDAISGLSLPRYGLGNYVAPQFASPPTPDEAKLISKLSRAGKRLLGFCRTNLFKRLESSGHSFLLSVERHILRNFVFLHAIETGNPLPIGTLETDVFSAGEADQDDLPFASRDDDDDDDNAGRGQSPPLHPRAEDEFKRLASEVFKIYRDRMANRFDWLRSNLFITKLRDELLADARALLEILTDAGEWSPATDAKFLALRDLITTPHRDDKLLVFTQFADTAEYLHTQLAAAGITRVELVTGDTADPTDVAWRFSPVSNGKRDEVRPQDEPRVLITTDVLSEGQNLQDAFIVVNYDLPWAIIRLVQRVGRVDRIGQKSPDVLCYTSLPADGVERIITLRSRLRQRLKENAEVVGSDEAFFEDDMPDQTVRDLFTEKSGVLDDERDTEVDLASRALAIWRDAIKADPSIERLVEALPNVVYSTKPFSPLPDQPEGALVYARTARGHDSLVWIDRHGESVSESPLAILQAAECRPNTPMLERLPEHHNLVARGIELIAEEEKSVGGQLGRPSGARFKTYELLKQWCARNEATLFGRSDFADEVRRAVDEIYRFPPTPGAIDTLNRQLRAGITDDDLAALVVSLRRDGKLCRVTEEQETGDPQIICSLGLRSLHGGA